MNLKHTIQHEKYRQLMLGVVNDPAKFRDFQVGVGCTLLKYIGLALVVGIFIGMILGYKIHG